MRKNGGKVYYESAARIYFKALNYYIYDIDG